MDFKVGELYLSSTYHIFAFSTEKTAASAYRFGQKTSTPVAASCYVDATGYLETLSKELGCDVFCIPIDVSWMVVEIGGFMNDFQQVKMISTNGKFGWINTADWMQIEELKA